MISCLLQKRRDIVVIRHVLTDILWMIQNENVHLKMEGPLQLLRKQPLFDSSAFALFLKQLSTKSNKISEAFRCILYFQWFDLHYYHNKYITTRKNCWYICSVTEVKKNENNSRNFGFTVAALNQASASNISSIMWGSQSQSHNNK